MRTREFLQGRQVGELDIKGWVGAVGGGCRACGGAHCGCITSVN